MKTATLSFVLLFISAIGAFAQSASEVTISYLAAFESGEYQKAAEFFDPDALKDFRKMLNFSDALPEEQAKRFYTAFFGDNASRESVSRMSDVEFFSGFLAFLMNQAQVAGGMSLDKGEILGEVPEGANIVHVVTRSHVSVGDLEMEAMEVISFRKIDGHWKVLLSGKVKGMAVQLRRAFEREG